MTTIMQVPGRGLIILARQLGGPFALILLTFLIL